MEKKKIWNILKTLLKISITGLSLYLVSREVEFKDLSDAFDKSNPVFLFLVIHCVCNLPTNLFFASEYLF